ncbi:MAG: DUF2007 domain-containing protein [Bacteroidota bacterium]
MEKDWVNIYNSTQVNNIEIVKGVLAENGIQAIDINKKDSSYLFGEIELYVNKKDVLRAIHIIKKNRL